MFQSPYKITQAISRMNSIAIVKIPPCNSQRQAINNPSRATPVRLNKKISTDAIDPGPPESAAQKIRRKKTVTRTFQMRAIQRMILTERGRLLVLFIKVSVRGNEIYLAHFYISLMRRFHFD